MQNKSLAWAPPLYFLYYAAAAALLPFLVVYYQELGLSGTQIGFLAGVPPLMSLLSAPVWGVVADKTQRSRLSILIAMVGAILLALILSAAKTFIWLILAVILFSFFSSPIMPLVDSTTMNLLGGEKERYGRIRLWGAVGWGIAAPIVGALIELGSVIWSFWSYAGLLGLGLISALKIPERKQLGKAPHAPIRLFLHDSRWLIFLTVSFCGGMALSMNANFLFIFLQDLGADKFTLGLSLTIATLSELPVLFFSSRLLRRWNAQQLLGAALLIVVIRTLAYSFVVVPWLVLLIQLLHGPSFALMWVAGVSYVNKIAPSGLEATAQGLFSGVMLGVGSAIGAFLGGFLYEYVGIVSMFRVASIIALIGVVFMFLVEKKNREYSL
jgi:oligosaccharide:H+ symporter